MSQPTGSESTKVAVLRGGYSREAEVSAKSAREVAAGLETAGYTVAIIDLGSALTRDLLDFNPHVVFPALHGSPGEDGTVQGFLEMLDLPYVGAGVHGSATAMDKSLAKAVFARAGLPVLPDVVVAPDRDVYEAASEVLQKLGERIVVKPLAQGSALGVQLLPNGGDIAAAINNSREAAADVSGPAAVLVEPYVMGREMTVGVLDLEGAAPQSFPVIEIRTAQGEWYDFTNRYTVGRSEHILPAPISSQASARIREIGIQAHQSLGLHELSRADLIVTDDESITLLEVNTLPGMTPTSLYPDGARAVGYSFSALMQALVASAQRRHKSKTRLS